MSPILVVGATRGLGASVAKLYAQQGKTVYGTMRSADPPKDISESIQWVPDIDLMKPSVGDDVVAALGPSKPLEAVVSRIYSRDLP